jgi:hypothetical protein
MTESHFLPLATYTELRPEQMQRRVDDFEAQLTCPPPIQVPLEGS